MKLAMSTDMQSPEYEEKNCFMHYLSPHVLVSMVLFALIFSDQFLDIKKSLDILPAACVITSLPLGFAFKQITATRETFLAPSTGKESLSRGSIHDLSLAIHCPETRIRNDHTAGFHVFVKTTQTCIMTKRHIKSDLHPGKP